MTYFFRMSLLGKIGGWYLQSLLKIDFSFGIKSLGYTVKDGPEENKTHPRARATDSEETPSPGSLWYQAYARIPLPRASWQASPVWLLLMVGGSFPVQLWPLERISLCCWKFTQPLGTSTPAHTFSFLHLLHPCISSPSGCWFPSHLCT